MVLFDEFDKAHPDVKKLLFQILEEGELTDSAGKKISFRHAIVILTSNLGAELFKSAGIGFGGNGKDNPDAGRELESLVVSKLKEEFGTSLIGRIKNICVFRPLDEGDMEAIIKNHINKLSKELTKTKKLSIAADAKALSALAKETHDEDVGARNMEMAVEKILHDLIISEMQKKEAKKNYKLTKVQQTYKLV